MWQTILAWRLGLKAKRNLRTPFVRSTKVLRYWAARWTWLHLSLISKINQLKLLLQETRCWIKKSNCRKKKLLLWRKRLPTPPPLSGRPTSGRSPGRYSLTTPKQSWTKWSASWKRTTKRWTMREKSLTKRKNRRTNLAEKLKRPRIRRMTQAGALKNWEVYWKVSVWPWEQPWPLLVQQRSVREKLLWICR